MNKFGIIILSVYFGLVMTDIPTACNQKSVTFTEKKVKICKRLPILGEDNGNGPDEVDPEDKYCCLWDLGGGNYFCGSISDEQYWHIKNYVKDKKAKDGLDKLTIKCAATQIKMTFISLLGLLILFA